MPCRYISGNTSLTFGLLRHHGGTITDANCRRPPVSSSVRRSLTRGALDLDPTRGGGDGAWLCSALAGDEPVAVFASLICEGGDVGVDLRLQGHGQHLARSFTDDLVEPVAHLRAGVVVTQYSQHRRSFLAGVPPPATSRFGQRGRYAAPSNGWLIHRFWL
jgi:hypothetical protein